MDSLRWIKPSRVCFPQTLQLSSSIGEDSRRQTSAATYNDGSDGCRQNRPAQNPEFGRVEQARPLKRERGDE
jgi:hypothetical protein